MLDTKITEQVRKLTASERFALIEFTFSLLKQDLQQRKSGTNADSESFVSTASRMAEAGANALRNGAPMLPSDFASNHDTYVYGKNSS